MTKEELEKEAEEYRTHFENELYLFNNTDIFPRDIEEAYLAGAEPREKQIQALGERCLQLQKDKGNLTDRANELEETINKLREQFALRYELEDKVKELEQENAGLKDDNKAMADNYSKMEQKFYDNLTKAKEIIKELSKYVSDSKWYVQNGYVELRKELVAKAEQFVKNNA